MQRNPHSYQIATGYRTFYSLSLIYQPITKKRLFFDKKSLSSVPYEQVREGFKPVDMPDGLNQEEKERIDACIFTVGPTWYKALKENVNHIDTNR